MASAVALSLLFYALLTIYKYYSIPKNFSKFESIIILWLVLLSATLGIVSMLLSIFSLIFPDSRLYTKLLIAYTPFDYRFLNHIGTWLYVIAFLVSGLAMVSINGFQARQHNIYAKYYDRYSPFDNSVSIKNIYKPIIDQGKGIVYVYGKGISSDLSSQIFDQNNIAETPNEARFIVYVRIESTIVGSYIPKGTAYREDLKVYVLDWQTKEIVSGIHVFEGNPPPKTISPFSGSGTGSAKTKEFIKWARLYLNDKK
jgi:hypothetical protein